MTTLPKFLKPIKKTDTLRSVYLYRDGHAVASYERHDRDTDTNSRYAKVAAPGLLHVGGDFTRLILEPAMARMLFSLPGEVSIVAHGPALYRGTENTKRLNQRVSDLTVQSAFGTLLLASIPDQMAADWRVQDDPIFTEKWEDLAGQQNAWGGTRIANPEDLPAPIPNTAEAANSN